RTSAYWEVIWTNILVACAVGRVASGWRIDYPTSARRPRRRGMRRASFDMQHEMARAPVQNSLGHPPHREAPRVAVGLRTTGPGDPVDQPIVFVIDDDDSVRRALERLLRSVDLDVQTFSSAREFIDLPLPDRPACIVLDLRLPGPTGL